MVECTDDMAKVPAEEIEVISCHLLLVVYFIVISVKINVLWILNIF